MRTRGWGVALAAVALMAACGDGAEPPPPTTTHPPPGTPATTTSPPAPTTTPPTTTAALPPATTAPPSDGTCTPLPAGATTVDVTPVWRAGDTVRLDIGVSRSGTGVTPVDREWTVIITVLDVLDEGYRLEWETDEQVIDPEVLAAAGVGAEAIGRLDALSRSRIEYVADNFGAYVGIVNVEELMARTAEQLAIFEAEFFGDDTSEEGRVAREVLSALATDPELVEAVVGERLREYHGLYGALAEAGEPITAPATLPNVLGDEPIPATRVQEVTAVADDGGCAVLTTTTEPEPSELQRMLDDVLAEAGDAAEGLAPLLEGFSVRAERRHRWDPGSGWMIEVDVRETTSSPLVDRVEATTITAVPPG